MATALLIATRPLEGAVTGRTLVLRTIVRSLATLGHDVVVAHFGAAPDGTAPWPGPARTVRLPGPRPLSVLSGGPARRRGLRTLNERLYWNPRALDVLRRVVAEEDVEVVVADQIRMAPYAESLGLPAVIDLDDLLSRRYVTWRQRDLSMGELIGFRRPQQPFVGRVLDAMPANRLLASETGRVAAREVELARSGHAVSLVSPVEAQELAASSGRHVHNLPMSLEVAARRSWDDAPLDRRLAFAGALTTFTNLEAVRWWVDELEPGLRARGLDGWQLWVYGDAPAEVRARLQVPSVVLCGGRPYEELHRELTGFQLYLAPMREALGLTTKVIEAALLNLVVLPTARAVSGMDVEDGRDCMVWETVDDLADRLRAVGSMTPGQRATVAREGERWASEAYGPAALAAAWAEALLEVGVGSAPLAEVARAR